MKRESAWTCQCAYEGGYTNILSLAWMQELKGGQRGQEGIDLGWSGMSMGILQSSTSHRAM